jgi:uncharacterized protein (DUF2249 family)
MPIVNLKGLSTMTASATATPAAVDLRTIAARDRHATVFNRFDALPPGRSLELVSDHDPLPLRLQLDERVRGQFEWAALESGPQAWRVQITRVGAKPMAVASDSCCSGGACCG